MSGRILRVFLPVSVILAVLALPGCLPRPQARFFADVKEGRTPLTVQFEDKSYLEKSVEIVSWEWNFGDGTTSAEQNPSHTYVLPGWFNVSLTVRTNRGQQATFVQTRMIHAIKGYADGGTWRPCEMMPVPGGVFTMGATDEEMGEADEYPRHEVNLSPYAIGKYEVTNREFADMLNWALVFGSLSNDDGEPYDGGSIYFGREKMLDASQLDAILYDKAGQYFYVASDIGAGGQQYSRAEHPVFGVTWIGAVIYCNWLSVREGLEPAYEPGIWRCNLNATGYRLPTEAEWERAAGWDGEAHWRYPFDSTVITENWASFLNGYTGQHVNPMGLAREPFTSPAGWFNGVNVSPRGLLPVQDAVSPAGCYDMGGNVREWCNDWYPLGLSTYYTFCAAQGTVTDPAGPDGGAARVTRGGSWNSEGFYCRSANRGNTPAALGENTIGFRLCRSMNE